MLPRFHLQMKSRTIFVAFAFGLFAQLKPATGESGIACVGQDCLAQESDEVTLLQLSKDVSHRVRSMQPSHQAAATPPIANASVAEEAAALARYAAAMTPEFKEPLQADASPTPDIMLVLGVAVALAIATWTAYYLGLLMCQNLPSETAAEAENVLDLMACFAGIIICFCSYGVAQEFIMTQLYGDEKFPSVTFLILCNRIFIVAVAVCLLTAKGEGILWKPTLLAVFPGASSMASSWCQYECLHYVTFPTQVVFKSAKIVPTMMLNTVVNFVWQPFSDYVQALIITGCVIGFSLLTEDGDAGESNTVVGLVMLCIFLLGDALTSNGEKYIYTRYPDFSNTQMMFAMGIVGLCYSAVLSAFTSGGYPVMFAFIHNHPTCLTQILALSICSMSGQYLIYYIIQRHGPVVMAIMMTVRQILSIFVSAALYGHVIPTDAVLLACLCFAVVLAKPIYKWYNKPKEVRALKQSKLGH